MALEEASDARTLLRDRDLSRVADLERLREERWSSGLSDIFLYRALAMDARRRPGKTREVLGKRREHTYLGKFGRASRAQPYYGNGLVLCSLANAS